MQYVPVSTLFELSAMFAKFEKDCEESVRRLGTNAGNITIEQTKRDQWLVVFEKGRVSPEMNDVLPFAMETMRRIGEALKDPTITLWKLGELLRDFQSRMFDELNKQVYEQVRPGVVPLRVDPLRGWGPVIEKFPDVESDVREASLCLVYDRFTASVFHQMRVMDFGLNRLRQMVRVPLNRPGWEGVIEAIDTKLKPKHGQRKSGAMRKRLRFLGEAVLQLRAVKEIRNTTMHDWSKSYTPEQSAALYSSVHTFMLKMAEVA
jgi:hypothetical protein